MTPDELVAALNQAAEDRESGEAQAMRANGDVKRLLRLAQETPGITMIEAATAARISRAYAYRLLEGDSR